MHEEKVMKRDEHPPPGNMGPKEWGPALTSPH